MTLGKNAFCFYQQGAPVFGVFFCKDKHVSGFVAVNKDVKVDRNVSLHLPLCTLKTQGSLHLCVTSGHAACDFHVLAKFTAVPSVSPFVVLKSSASTSLKSPHRPAKTLESFDEIFTAKCGRSLHWKHTLKFPFLGNTGFDENLHQRRELNLKVESIDGVDDDVEC